MTHQTRQFDNEKDEEIHRLRCQLFVISFERGEDDSKKRTEEMKAHEAEIEGQRRALAQWRDEMFEQSKVLNEKQEKLEVFFII